MTTLAVLTKPWKASPTAPPESWPLGRAALQLAEEGIDVVFSGEIHRGVATGQRARPGRWEAATAPVRGAWDRFPSQTCPEAWEALLTGLNATVLGNPPELTLLCRDKVDSQHALQTAGVRMPELEHRPEHLQEALERWGTAFAKPRHGALGRGVTKVDRSMVLSPTIEGAVPGSHDELILQRGVPLWRDFAGLCVRALVQRQPDGSWHCCDPVARTHPTDPVANVARGASVLPAQTLFGSPLTHDIRALALQAAVALGADACALELGVDIVVDATGEPWVIEVNGVPRGHLSALAKLNPAQWSQAHLEACCRPLRRLAALAD